MEKSSKITKNNKNKYDGKYYNSSFATTLRNLLEKKEFNQQQLAKKLDVSRQTISLYANGNSLPDIETLKKIVNYFKDNGYDYSCDYWLGLISDPTTNVEAKEINKKYGLSKKSLKNLEYINTLKKNKTVTHIKTINLILSQDNYKIWTLIDRYLNIKIKDERILAVSNDNFEGKESIMLEEKSTNLSLKECVEGGILQQLSIQLSKLKNEGKKNEC